MRPALFILLLACIVPVAAQPRQSLVPGGLAIVELAQDDPREFSFRGKPVLITEINGMSTALVGLPLSLKPGEHFIEARANGQVFKKFFRVEGKEYTTQHITITDKRKVNPWASDMDRILKEKARKQKARNHYRSGEVDVDFLLPVDGIRTGSLPDSQ